MYDRFRVAGPLNAASLRKAFLAGRRSCRWGASCITPKPDASCLRLVPAPSRRSSVASPV